MAGRAGPHGPLRRLHALGFTPGLRLGARSLGIALGAGLAFGLFMALADASLFSAAVPEVQHRMLATMDLGLRLRLIAPGVLHDEVLLRFAVLVPLVWMLAALRGRVDAASWWIGIVVVAGVAWPLSARGYLGALDWGGLAFARELVLHGGAGVLWGWLCWRHGWLAGLCGHFAAHLALQPLLGMWG